MARATGSWGEPIQETGNCNRSEPSPKTRRISADRLFYAGMVCRGALFVRLRFFLHSQENWGGAENAETGFLQTEH